jgi:hypothetical protein
MQLHGLALRGTPLRDFSGTIIAGGTVQSVLPAQPNRSYLLFENLSSGILSLDFGPARATAVLTSGAVTSVTVNNSGALYTYPPLVQFLGGVIGGVGFPVPGSNDLLSTLIPTVSGSPAQAYTTISGGVVSSIVVTNPGSGYSYAPYVDLKHDPRDPFGGAAPSATSGFILQQYGSIVLEASTCSTDQVLVYGGTTGQAFTCKVII